MNMPPITLELTTEEAQWLARCLDLATKQNGLQGISLTHSLHQKIITGLQRAQVEAPPEKKD